MSKRDFIRAGIDEHPDAHEHEWGPPDDPGPLIEDGAAVFTQRCRHYSGPHGHGDQCEATNSFRLEYDVLVTPTETVSLHPITEWEQNNEKVRDKVIEIEERWMNGDDVELASIDPTRNGEVVLRMGDYELAYR